MLQGKYRVVKEIHIYDCTYGQLKMGKGVIFEVKIDGLTAYADNISFPTRLLDGCEEYVERIRNGGSYD